MKNGYGVILFDSAQDAQEAMAKKQEQQIGERVIKLFNISYGEYQKFNVGGEERPKKDVSNQFTDNISSKINSENEKKCLLIKNLPFRIRLSDICKFFSGFGKLELENVFLEESAPKRLSGLGLVVFESEEIAQEAKESKDGEKIGLDERARDVKLFDCNDDQMKEVRG